MVFPPALSLKTIWNRCHRIESMSTYRLRPSEQFRPNRVIPVLAALALLLVWTPNLGAIQPNRIVPGEGYGLLAAVGSAGAWLVSLGLIISALLSVLPIRFRFHLLVTLLSFLLALTPLLLSFLAQRHLPDNAPYARTSVGAAFWSLLFLLSLMLTEALSRLKAHLFLRSTLFVCIVAMWLWLFASDPLSSVSLVREFNARPGQFAQALWEHLALAFGAVGISLVFAFFLSLKMIGSQRWRRPILSAVSFLQTIPSLAVFGLLIAPLSALSAAFPWLQEFGIRGIGWAPAMLALIAYSLLPMVRNNYVALTEIPVALIDAGRGMGMSERQLFFQLKLPLALPVMVEGVRITTIQAIGLTAVAALIGAGGFGTFIFQGLGQAAMDLVLLGALPTIILALAADAALTLIGNTLTPGQTTE